MQEMEISFNDLTLQAQDLVDKDFRVLVNYESLTELPNGELTGHKILHIVSKQLNLNTFIIDKYSNVDITDDSKEDIIKYVISDNILSQSTKSYSVQFICKDSVIKGDQQLVDVNVEQFIDIKMKIMRNGEVDKISGTFIVPYYSSIDNQVHGAFRFIVCNGECQTKVKFTHGGVYKFDYRNIIQIGNNSKLNVTENLNDITFIVNENPGRLPISI